MSKIKKVVVNAGKTAGELAARAKNAVVAVADQNNDGELNLQDVTVVREQIGERISEARQDAERKALQPLFLEDLTRADFLLPKLIRIADMDKKRKESAVCKGSIGFGPEGKGIKYITVFSECADRLGLTFLPDKSNGIYYADPVNKNLYISLDEYYRMLREARVAELEAVAQDLGAKHFRIKYLEEKKTFFKAEIEAAAKASVKKEKKSKEGKKETDKAEASVKNDLKLEKKTFEEDRVESENDFEGHDAKMPVLAYYRNDPSVNGLIKARLKADNRIKRKTLALSCSKSSGIKVDDALKIDAAIKQMKGSTGFSFAEETRTEGRRTLVFEIEF